MSIRVVGGRPINVVEQGTGRPVLFLHGNPNDHQRLLLTLDPLFEARGGFQRVHLDLPGFGASPADPEVRGSDGMLEVVVETMDSLFGDERLLIVGESWGAYLARGVVARRSEQVAGVALLCPVVIADRKQRDLPDHRVLSDAGVPVDAPTELADIFRSVAVVVGPEQWDQFMVALAPTSMTADRATIARIEAAYDFGDDVDAVGAPFEGPALIVVGRQDSVVGYRDALRLLDRFARSTFAVLDVAGHLMVSERPGLVANLVDDWLDRLEAEGRG